MNNDDRDLEIGRRQRRQYVLENAKRAGLVVGTVIDVGFAQGTDGLFEVFGDAHNVLIDPIAEMEPAMIDFCQERPNSSYVIAAASDSDGTAEIVARRVVGLSGFHSTRKAGDAEPRTVPTIRIDTLVRERKLASPFLLKLDVEGHELFVLQGAEDTLQSTDLVMLEIGTWTDIPKRGASSMMEIFNFMHQHGFAFHDIVEPVYRPLDGALWGFDGVWVKADGVLRQNRSYRSADAGAAVRKSRQERDALVFKA